MKFLLVAVVCMVSAWDVAWCSDKDNSWKLTTDDTAIVVSVRQGVPVVTQLSSVRGNSNWLQEPAPEILLSSVEQQGSPSATKWQYQGGTFNSQSGQLVLRFSNSSPAMELQSIWQARPGRGPVEHWLTIANNSGAPITIGHQDSLVLSHLLLPTTESMDAWWIKRGASNATNEGATLVRSVGRNSNETLTSDPIDGASPVPWLALQVGTSHGLYVDGNSQVLGEFISILTTAAQARLPKDLTL